jgi:hypothetical protein
MGNERKRATASFADLLKDLIDRDIVPKKSVLEPAKR